MNASAAPASVWLLYLQYVCVILNYMASPALGGICPILNGQTPDISFIQFFSFFEPVYYQVDHDEPDYAFPSASNQKKGYWVGFADHVGDAFTWKILTADTHKLIHCCACHSVVQTTKNCQLESPSGVNHTAFSSDTISLVVSLFSLRSNNSTTRTSQ